VTYDWDSASEILFDDVRILRANRERCLVCGHPTGDCADGAVAPARIVGAEFFANRPVKEPGVLVTEDIYEEINLTQRTKTKVLVAKAGTYISREKAERYGLIATA
jgi:hypothetical protein